MIRKGLGLIVTLICVVAITTAQSPETLILESPYGTISLDSPAGWTNTIAPEEVGLYAIATNRQTDTPTFTDIQMVIRHASELEEVIENTIDLDAANPALDYQEKYVAWRESRREGVYGEPVAIQIGDDDSADYPASLVLYAEVPDGARFPAETEAVLGLSLAVYLGDGYLGIILMDGAAIDNSNLLNIWARILPTVTVNDEDLQFTAENLDAFPTGLELVADFRALLLAQPDRQVSVIPLDSPTQQISYNNNFLVLPVYEGWEITSLNGDTPDAIQLANTDGVMNLAFQAVTATFTPGDTGSVLSDLVDNDPDYELNSDLLDFHWNGQPSTIATIHSDDAELSEGVIVVTQIERSVLIFRFDYASDVSEQTSSDWWATITQLQLNGERLKFEDIGVALSHLNNARR